MNPARWRRAEELFNAALDHRGEERTAFLDRACAGDAGMRAAVDRLISCTTTTSRIEEVLDRGVPETLVRRALEYRPLEGQRIGNFEITGILGSGGMATVLKAEQRSPPRTVALKIMRFGLLSESARRRFEFESEILGKLHHPGIAQVFSTGTHRDPWSGQDLPYFAMEYVPGARTLDHFVEQEHPDITTTLRLFVQVCEAVHYGHQNGVIHRDLKPQNILIDNRSCPVIIDFGIARATSSQAGDPRTIEGAVIGTLHYMSPEQADSSHASLDLRCDVYSLGAILYELLTGRRPFDFEGVPVTAAIETIRHVMPPRPSTVTTRHSGQRLSQDLDWITRRALEKDPRQRYASVHELVTDIERALSDQPVVARPPSGLYLASKFVRRHRLAVAAAAIVVVALLTAVVVVSASLAEARLESATRKDVSDFLEDMLSSVNPYVDGREVRVIDLLDRAAARADALHGDRPELAIELHRTIGSTYVTLGQHDTGRQHLDRAVELGRLHLGADHEMTLQARLALANCLHGLGDSTGAEALAESALVDVEATLGHGSRLAAKAMVILGLVAYERKDHERATELYERAYRVYSSVFLPHELPTLQTAAALGQLYAELGRYAAAHEMLDSVDEIGTKHLGPEHPVVLIARHNRGTLLFAQDKNEEAARVFDGVLKSYERVLGKSHPRTLTTLNNLASAHRRLGQIDTATEHMRTVVERRRAPGLYQHHDTAIALGNLGVCLTAGDHLDQAEEAFGECFAVLEQCGIGDDHWLNAAFRKGLGVLRTKQGRHAEAETILKQSLTTLENASGDHTERIERTLEALAELYGDWGRPKEAEAVLRRLDRD